MSVSGSPLTVGITGPRGFIARHVARYLSAGAANFARKVNVSPCPRETFLDVASLFEFVETCDTLIHLAGTSRGSEREIYENNLSLVDKLIGALEATNAPSVPSSGL